MRIAIRAEHDGDLTVLQILAIIAENLQVIADDESEDDLPIADPLYGDEGKVVGQLWVGVQK